MDPYCLVDALAEPITDLEIMWCEPTAHPLGLQIRMQPLRKRLIFAGITDEARGKLDCPPTSDLI